VKRLPFVCAVSALFAAGTAAQFGLAALNPVKAPVAGESFLAAMGGLRSIAAEIVWFRLDRLQETGRYGELVQLSSLLAFLEPHESEVWVYTAWNMAYNISVRMPSEEDRWPWVYEAVKLLRGKGLALNPSSAAIYREIAFLFELKIGADIDSAAPFYRREWKKLVEDAAARGAWSELDMDPAEMARIAKEEKIEDWTDPQASAIYWARLGLERSDARSLANSKDGAFLKEVLRQARMLYAKNHGG